MNHYKWIILGMALVTLIPRILPTLLFSRVGMPKRLARAIRYVPISVFSYLVATEVLFVNNQLSVSFANMKVVPSIATLIVAFKTRSIGITIGFGVAAYLLYSFSMSEQAIQFFTF